MIAVLVVFGVVLAVLLVVGSGKLRRPGTIGLVAVMLVLCAIVLASALNHFALESVISGYVDEVAERAGLDPFLAKTIGFLLVIPFGTALIWVFSFSPSKRRMGSYAMALFSVLYFGALWFVTADQKITRTGEPLKCYVVNEDRVTWRDMRYQGLDPVTGRPCEPAEPYLLPILSRLDALLREGGRLTPIDPREQFFSAIGEPVIWYARKPDGGFEFFGTPGYHPSSGERLNPATSEMVQQWNDYREEQYRAATARRAADLAEAERQAQIAAEREAAEQAESDRLALVRQQEDEARAQQRQVALEAERLASLRALVLPIVAAPGSMNLGLALVPERNDQHLDRVAADRLKSTMDPVAPASLTVVREVFGQGFVADGHFHDIVAGELGFLEDSKVFSFVDYLMLGSVRADCRPGTAGLRSCVVSVSTRVYRDGRLLAAETVSEIGPGFSDENAAARGAELLSERWGRGFLMNLGGQE
ncbi:hypothetical protein [Devosia sp. CAU 1758]